MSKVSIIIPIFNRKDLIKYTLDSVSPELHPDVELEVLVVDDGSTDGVMDFIAENFPNVRRFKNDLKGPCSARNVALRNATGDYIMYLDSDDTVGPGYFKEKVRLLDETTEYNTCWGEYDYFSGNEEVTDSSLFFTIKKFPYNEKDTTKEYLIKYLSGHYIPGHSIIWRKELMLKIGGHNINTNIQHDVDIMIRALLNGAKLLRVNDGKRIFVRCHSVDHRSGSYYSTKEGSLKALQMRKTYFQYLKQYNMDKPEYLHPFSQYLFIRWASMMRNGDKETADKFLAFAKEVYWPIEIPGSKFSAILGKIFGPVNGIKVRDGITKLMKK